MNTALASAAPADARADAPADAPADVKATLGPVGHESTVTGADPCVLLKALEADDRFRRDTLLSGIFHPGKICYRELKETDSLHIIIDGEKVSAHVDAVNPLNLRPEKIWPYDIGRVLAHNLKGGFEDIGRRIMGLHGSQRCNLRCEAVWVDNERGPSEPASDGPVRVAFGAIDEAVHLLDSEAAPWGVQLELRVAGRLDEARFRVAVADALQTHPMARACKAPSQLRQHRDHWEIPVRPDLDPVRVSECADDISLQALRTRLYRTTVPLAESPPLRLCLVHHPEGDVVMLNANHAAMDGFGALRLMCSIAAAYAGRDDPPPSVDFDEARDRLRQLVAGSDLSTRTRRYLALADKLVDLVRPPARIAPTGATAAPGYGFHHVALTAHQTAALADLAQPGTVNDVLLAALHIAIAGWNEEQGRRCNRIGVLVPANLRPAEWRDDVVGNFSLPARVSTRRRERRSRHTTLAAVITRTRRKKETGLGTALVELLARSDRHPLWFKRSLIALLPLTGDRLVDTAMLSNLGRIENPPSFGPDAGDITQLWFSPPGRMPLGLTIGAATVGDRLHLTFRYRCRLFGDEAARRFAELFVREIATYTASWR